MTRHRIAMVSDYFYPNLGGVEMHIYQLSQCLIARGHKVIVVTHAYNDRVGVRYLTSNLKVYYLPLSTSFTKPTVFPAIYTTMPIFRQIFIREGITIVHGHSAFSTLAHEAILHARNMAIKTIFTDHSLFGFADTSSVLTNKLLKFTLADNSHVICVSHTSRENTVLRAKLNPHGVSVIPNAVDPTQFVPNPERRPDDGTISIVIASRLCYRKGTDILAAVIPPVCERYPRVNFLIAGSGDKRILLEEAREKHGLIERVKLLGEVQHHRVPEVLAQGHIFVNTSLTEAFCIAIVEAAYCGLQVVSTNVGGVPEVLPEGLIELAEPSADSLLAAICRVVERVANGDVLDPHAIHRRVSRLYTWQNVAERTERVYNVVAEQEEPTVRQRFLKYKAIGPVSGWFFVFVAASDLLFLYLLRIFVPDQRVQRAIDLH